MDVCLNVRPLVCALDTLVHQGQIIVDDHVNLHDVDSSGNDIRGD